MLQQNSQMRGQLATRLTHLVDCHYGFVDLKKDEVIEKNKELCARLRLDTAFYFKVSTQNYLLNIRNIISARMLNWRASLSKPESDMV